MLTPAYRDKPKRSERWGAVDNPLVSLGLVACDKARLSQAITTARRNVESTTPEEIGLPSDTSIEGYG